MGMHFIKRLADFMTLYYNDKGSIVNKNNDIIRLCALSTSIFTLICGFFYCLRLGEQGSINKWRDDYVSNRWQRGIVTGHKTFGS